MDFNVAWLNLNEYLRETESNGGGLDAALRELENHQQENGFIKDDLAEVQRYVFPHPQLPELSFNAQYNPKRALRFNGSGERTPPAGTESLNDGCFLCRENIRWQQNGAQVGFEISTTEDNYHAWMNPFPLLPNHVIIAEEDHIPQAWDMTGENPEQVALSRLLNDLCETAYRLPNHIGFYNGVDAGASIPGHLHFHFFHRPAPNPVFPLETRQFHPAAEPGGPQIAVDYPVPVALWRGHVSDVVANAVSWMRRWAKGNENRLGRLSSNFIATGTGIGDSLSLYFIPRDRAKQRWHASHGLVGGLELLGELVFSSEQEKALLEQGAADYSYVEQALASVHTPFSLD